MQPISLIEKYKPQSIQDLVLSPKHGIALSLQFLANPYPAAFLHYGKSGLGKTSLAELMARAASPNPLCVRRFAGPDLTSDAVRELTALSTASVFGRFYTVIVNEADAIPRLAQIRLLDLMDRLAEHHLILLLTTNEEIPDFDSRFISRLKPQLFTAQALAPRARDWLLKIADAERIPLSKKEAARIVKLSHNNLRGCLQALQLHGAERVVMSPASGLPDVPAPKDTVQTVSRAVANERPTVAF